MRNPRIIEALYADADKALNQTEIVYDNKVKHGEYEGYIAGFGANVINMGIKPAIAAYCAKPPDNVALKPSKKKVIDAIAQTLNLSNSSDADSLLKKVIDERDNYILRDLKEKIVNASVALKIMIRTYEIKKDKKDKDHE